MSQQHRIAARFPEEWTLEKAHGFAGYVTRLIHRLPDGRRHIWASRPFRKRRATILKNEQCESCTCRQFRWWGWMPLRLSWWVAIIFTLGSILFFIAGIGMMIDVELGGNLLGFIGSVFFSVGSYLAFLEVINLKLDVTLEREVEALTGRLPHTPGPEGAHVRLFDWQPHRLEFRAALIQLGGALLFNINCWYAMNPGLPWWLGDWLVWTPSTVASVCFTVASYLLFAEICHGAWAWRPREIEWWLTILNLIGSLGFLGQSVFGYFAQGPVTIPQAWTGNLAFFIGSTAFLIGSYLMVPELFDNLEET